MSYFDQFIKYRALKFKFESMGSLSVSDIERMVENGSVFHTDDDGKTVRPLTLEEALPIPLRNVCAKLSVELVDRLDNTLSVLDISKREFIEMALIEALNQVDIQLAEVDAFEYIEARQASEGEAE